ncbi:MAG: FkbM family methyltransferase [Gammaproteobacteria bacterium]
MRSVTLPTLLEREGLDIMRYDTLVMDTQGSELLVLAGAAGLLPGFAFIKTEVPAFEAYEGCAQLAEFAAFMAARGFAELARNRFASRAAGGNYYDVIYQRAKS